MVNSKHLKGITVLGIEDGQQLGTIERAYLDPVNRRIAGFAVASLGGFLQPELDRLVDAEEVHSLGPDVMTVTDTLSPIGRTINARYAKLIDLNQLTGRQVITEGGTLIGQIASVEFDEASFRLTRLEASPGFFATATTFPVDHVITIGQDVVVVANAVCDPSRVGLDTSATPAADLLTLARRWYEETSVASSQPRSTTSPST